MAGTLAFPSFVTGPKDDLAAPDIYTLVDGTPINKIKPFTVEDPVETKKVSALQGGKALLEQVKAGLSVVSTAKALAAKGGDPLARLTNAQGGLMQLAKNLPKSMSGVSGMLGTYVSGLSVGLKQANGILAQVNGVKNKLKYGTDLAKLNALGAMINSVSCDKNVFSVSDRRAQVGAYAGVINMSMMAGIPGAYGAALKCESDHGILNQVTAACLPSTIRMSDITSLADMANKVKPGVITGLNPSTLADFNRNFSMPPGTSSWDMSSQFSTVKDTFGKIQPDWLSTSRGGETITNLSCVVGSSPDFQRMAMTSIMSNPNASDDDHAMLAVIGEPKIDVHADIMKQFPLMTDIRTSGTSSVSVDPSTINKVQSTGVFDLPPVRSGGNPSTDVYIDGVNMGSFGGSTTTTSTLADGTIKTKTTDSNGNVTTTYEPPQSASNWSAADEAAFAKIDKRYKGDLKGLLYGKSFIINEWMAKRITDSERELLMRCPYS